MSRFVARLQRGWQQVRYRQCPVEHARALGVKLGENCRLIATTSATFGSEPYLITIGNHVTISSGVRFVTHDGGVWVFRHELPDIDVIAPITVGSNVFVGANALVLPGVNIGDDVVIGAGSIVTKDVPSSTVCGGVPARVLSSLESYKERSLVRAIPTKHLTASEKRVDLERRFNLNQP